MAASDPQKNRAPRIANRKAHHDYHVHEKVEVGIKLMGSEVKSIRNSQVSLAEGFARVEPDGSLVLCGVDIAPYGFAHGTDAHENKRTRRLLAHKREIKKLQTTTTAKGTTLIPLAMYFVRGMVKVELGVCSGKKAFDKRQDMKQRDADREIRRGMTRRTI